MIAVLEGILFLCGDEGIVKEELKKVLVIEEKELNGLIASLKKECDDEKRGIELVEYGDILKFVTKKNNEEFYRKLVENTIDRPLTPAMLEALAIIAYNQPITRTEIDQLRGVASFHLIRRLLLKELIYEADRSTAPGRPIIYKTTSKFLDAIGVKSLEDLPPVEDLTEKEELDLFAKKLETE